MAVAGSLRSLLPLLACPYDGASLVEEGDRIVCPNGHRFGVVDGVPVLLRDDIRQTMAITSQSLRLAQFSTDQRRSDPYCLASLGLSENERDQVREAIAGNSGDIDPVVSYLVGATNGILYKHLVGTLPAYPIPVLPLPTAGGDLLLDIGCSWGRWSLAAARKGYSAVGLDPSLGAVLAAKRASEKLELPFVGVVGDARHLPFKPATFDAAFSYSVLQHFSKPDAVLALRNVRSVLKQGGKFAVQMASAWGVRSFQHQAMRRFRQPKSFEVRYWSPRDLKRAFGEIFGEVEMTADCFFGLGMQAADAPLMPLGKRSVIHASQTLKWLSARFPPLAYAADSVFLTGAVHADQNNRSAR